MQAPTAAARSVFVHAQARSLAAQNWAVTLGRMQGIYVEDQYVFFRSAYHIFVIKLEKVEVRTEHNGGIDVAGSSALTIKSRVLKSEGIARHAGVKSAATKSTEVKTTIM